MIHKLSEMLGIRIDELKIITILLLHIPLGYMYRLMPVRKNTTFEKRDILKRKIYGFIIGLISLLWILKAFEIMLAFFSYAIFYFLSFKCKNRKITFYINFINFFLLLLSHIHRMVYFYNENLYNINFLLMQSVPKQMYFNLYIFSMYFTRNRTLEKRREMISEKDEEIIDTEIPSFLDYICYLINFVGFIGPTSSYKEYKHFIHNTFKEEKIKKKQISEKLITLIIILTIYITSLKLWDFNYIKTQNFSNLFFPLKILFIYVQAIFERVRYYVAFILAEFSISTGNIKSSQNGYKNYSRNLKIPKIELSFSVRERVASWNIGTAKWLKEIIYLQILEIYKCSKSSANLFTFCVSAFWHGFYPSYYLGFFLANVASQIEQICYRDERLWFVPAIFASFVLDFAGVLFKVIEVRELGVVLRRTWSVLVVCLGGYFLLRTFGRRTRRKKKIE